MEEQNTKPGGRPASRVTPIMLSTLGNCPRRYEIEYEKNLRMAKSRPRPYPPSIKDLLHMMLDADEAMWPATLWEKAVLSASGFYGNELEQLKEVVQAIETEAMNILAHLNTKNRVSDHAESRRILASARFPVWGKKGFGRRGPWEFTARLDGLVEHDTLGTQLLVRKFTASGDPRQVVQHLYDRMDWVGLVWLAWQNFGVPINKVVFDVVRTKPPSRPATVKCARCKGAGQVKGPGEVNGGPDKVACPYCNGTGIGGISKSPCDTTAEIFSDAIETFAQRTNQDHAEHLAKHREQLDRLRVRGDVFAYTTTVHVQPEAIDAWLRDTVELLRSINLFRRRDYWPRNPAACRRTRCPYMVACVPNQKRQDEDVAWFRRVDDPWPGIRE